MKFLKETGCGPTLLRGLPLGLECGDLQSESEVRDPSIGLDLRKQYAVPGPRRTTHLGCAAVCSILLRNHIRSCWDKVPHKVSFRFPLESKLEWNIMADRILWLKEYYDRFFQFLLFKCTIKH